MAVGGINKWKPPRKAGDFVSKHQIQSEWKIKRMTRDGMAKPVSRDQILRRGQGHSFSLFS